MAQKNPENYRKVVLLHEYGHWTEALFRVPRGKGDPFERIRQKYEGMVTYRKIVGFVDWGVPDECDLECMSVEKP